MLALNSNFTLKNMHIKKIKALHYCLKNDKSSKISSKFIIGVNRYVKFK
jgi:hypothetical protein